MRPVARLHLGHLEGALRTWTRLQHEHECFFVIADWHALTTGEHDRIETRALTREILLDWYAAGLDPERCRMFVQSDVPEHAELALLLAMVTPVSWLERCTTYKEWLAQPQVGRSASLGLLGYPVLQAADILVYRADLIPVGRDQTQHLEITRDIAARFNSVYGEVFPLPAPLYSEFPLLPGTDGRKMTKAYGNTVHIGDAPAAIERKIATMFTDPAKVYRGDKGHPNICPVFTYHCCYNVAGTGEIRPGCESGEFGCVDCKGELSVALNAALEPIRERRLALADDEAAVREILARGAADARVAARETLARVREAMGLWTTARP